MQNNTSFQALQMYYILFADKMIINIQACVKYFLFLQKLYVLYKR
jgi:hypothetical protein